MIRNEHQRGKRSHGNKLDNLPLQNNDASSSSTMNIEGGGDWTSLDGISGYLMQKSHSGVCSSRRRLKLSLVSRRLLL